MSNDDLVKRLRNPIFSHGGTSAPFLEPTTTVGLMLEAADEIEKLRKNLMVGYDVGVRDGKYLMIGRMQEALERLEEKCRLK